MNKQIEIFYSKSKNKYVCLDEVSCDKCHKLIYHVGFQVLKYERRKKIDDIYCDNCIRQIKQDHAIICEFRLIYFKSKLPRDAYIIVPMPPILSNYRGDISTYEAAEPDKAHSMQVEDRTVLAGRETFYGFKIGTLDYKKDIKERLIQIELIENELKEQIVDNKKVVTTQKYPKKGIYK